MLRIWVVAFFLFGFGQKATAQEADPLSATRSAAFEDKFEGLDSAFWHVAEYDFSHPSFDTDWRKAQVAFDEGLTLSLSPHSEGINRYAGASVRTEDTLHYGRYSARIQAARGEGVITGFFTYTGPHYGTRHDEIDIELLGKDTTKLHVAWFVDGKLTNHFIPLGFDAADDMHEYAFEWRPDGLTWFVDGEQVYHHPRTRGAIPSLPSRLYANIWAADPSISNWSGTTTAGTQAQAKVDWIRFTPLPQLGSQSGLSW